MQTLAGACHCGALRVTFQTRTPLEQLHLRACGCSFCRKQGARTTSDPAGSLAITIGDPELLQRYRFATRTAETLICRNCGIYLGAIIEIESRLYGIVNVNVLDDQTLFDRAVDPMSYEHESADERIARRRIKWTPTELTGA